MSSAKTNRDYYISTVMPQLRMCNRPHENNENNDITFQRHDYIINYWLYENNLMWTRFRNYINATGVISDWGQRPVTIRFMDYDGKVYKKNAEHYHYFNNELQNCVKCNLATHLQYRLHI